MPPHVFIRNPYYFVVDPEGNQLPYIDRLQFTVYPQQDMIAATVASGEISMQVRHLNFGHAMDLMSRREESETKVLLWISEEAGSFAINLNHNRRIDPDQPETAMKAELLGQKRFKQALSLGINRKAIIRSHFFDVTQPVQGGPGPESPYYAPELLHAYTDHDPERANQLLDELWKELGGDPEARDRGGYRLFPDGTPMTFYLDFSPFTGAGPLPSVVEDWSQLGIRVVPRERGRTQFYRDRDSRDFDMKVWGAGNRYDLSGSVATSNSTFFAPGWGTWYDHGGLEGNGNVPGAVPVPEGHPMREAMQLWTEYTYEPSLERRQELSDRIAAIAAENLWTINLSSAPPLPVIVKKNMKNVPGLALYSFRYCSPANTGIETYYFEDEE
jgi:peptide/nickel transport system substrate-binding protein